MSDQEKAKLFRDRNLLFGVLAVQNQMVTPHQLAIAASTWATHPEKEIGEILLDLGFLDEKKCKLISTLLELHLEAHGGDTEATLSSFGGLRVVDDSFLGATKPTFAPPATSLVSFGGAPAEGSVSHPTLEQTPEMSAPPPSAKASLVSFGGLPSDSVSRREGPVSIFRLDDKELVTTEHPGRYSVKGERGRGGIGRVMVAFDEHIGREVALKELLAEGGTATGTPSGISPSRFTTAMARFLREARITGQLEHPGIVPVYEIGRKKEGTLYYTMKLVRGETLSRRLKACHSLAERLQYLPHFLALCQAMAYAHSRGVIHRDLKPQNVMVGEFGETVLLDWGMAKLREGSDIMTGEPDRGRELIKAATPEQTLNGQTLGTPSYMSPEQAEGRVAEVDERSDVWSLGAILYVILTGEAPFTGDSSYEVMFKVIKEEIKPIRELEPKAPPELCAIAEKCLSRDRTKRYAHAGELAQDVAAFQSGGLVSAYDYSMTALALKWMSKRWPLVLTLSLALLVLISFGAWSFLRIRTERNTAQDREKEARLNLALACIQKGQVMEEKNLQNEARVYYATSLLTQDSPQARSGLYRELTNPLRTRLFWMKKFETEDLRSAAFTPDGKLLAVGLCLKKFNAVYCEKTQIEVLEIPSGKVVSVLGQTEEERRGDSRRAITFSPDGELLLSAYCGAAESGRCLLSAVRVWEVKTGKLLKTLTGTNEQVTNVAVSPDGKFFAACGCKGINNPQQVICLEGEIKLWEREKLPPGPTAQPTDHLLGHSDHIMNLVFSPDSKFLVSSGYDKKVMVWDLHSHAPLHTLAGHEAKVYALVLSPDGKIIASGSNNNDIILWDLETGKQLKTLLGHTDSIVSLAFSPDGKFLASGADDRTVKIWDTETGQCVRTLTGYPNAVRRVSFSNDGKFLGTAALDGTVRIWEMVPGQAVHVFSGHQNWVNSVAISPDGKTIATGSMDGTIRLWGPEGTPVATIDLPKVEQKPLEVEGVAISPAGDLLAFIGHKGAVGLVDLKQAKLVKTLAGHADRGQEIRFSPDGKFILSAGDDSYAKLWDTASGNLVQEFFCNNFGVYTAAFVPGKDYILTGSSDRLLRVWNRELGVKLGEVNFKSEVRFLDYSPDHKLLAVGTNDREIYLLDPDSLETLRTLKGHQKAVLSFAFSPDGKYLASVSGDRTARLWDVSSGKELYAMTGHTMYVWAVAFSPDGQWIVTGSGDGTARKWPLLPHVFLAPVNVLYHEAITETGLRLAGFDLEPWNPFQKP